MNFISAIFLTLIIPTVFFYYILILIQPSGKAALWLLLGASLVFYGYHNPIHLLLIAGIAYIAYLFGLRIYGMQKGRESKGVYGLAVIATLILLLPLIYFKYSYFVCRTIGGCNLPAPGEETVQWYSPDLPLGISFFTFQAISYVTDLHRRRVGPVRSFKEFLLYISFLPQLVAGPIVTAREFFPQLKGSLLPGPAMVRGALFFLGSGIIKKAILADRLAAISDPIFQSAGTASWRSLTIGMVAYTLQIYFDFGAYSDLAIGLGKLFGFELPVNFQFPYSATGFRDFWRRWHITLSVWLRDHIYIPMGGSRTGPARMFAALFVTMSLGGLWHGAHWNFLIWGMAHGLLLIIERAISGRFVISFPGRRIVARIFTFIAVSLLWIPFRTGNAGGFRAMLDYYDGLFSLRSGGLSNADFRFVLSALILVFILPRFYNQIQGWFFRAKPILLGVISGIFLFFAVALATESEQFIYFVF